MRVFILTAALLFAFGANAKPISADIATHRIELHASFSGAELLLFGARNDPGDILAVIRGPERNMLVRKKERIAGMWMHVAKAKYDHVPQFFALASTKPLREITNESLLQKLMLTPMAAITRSADATTPHDFHHALLRIQTKARLYDASPAPISFFGETLFKTHFQFPDRLPPGDYTAEIYLIDKGRLVASQSIPFTAIKTGFEAWIYALAHTQPLLYGLLSLSIALASGWLAHRIFRKR